MRKGFRGEEACPQLPGRIGQAGAEEPEETWYAVNEASGGLGNCQRLDGSAAMEEKRTETSR